MFVFTTRLFFRRVTLVDTTRPVIELVGPASIMQEIGEAYTEPGMLAYDQADGIITNQVTVVVRTAIIGKHVYEVPCAMERLGTCVDTTLPPHTNHTIEFRVVDTAGLNQSAVRVVTLHDTQPPRLQVAGPRPLEYTIRAGDDFALPGCTCTDANDGDVPCAAVLTMMCNPVCIASVTNAVVNATQPGTYTAAYTCSDSAGHEAREPATVVVLNAAPAPPLFPGGGADSSNTGGTGAGQSIHIINQKMAQATSGFEMCFCYRIPLPLVPVVPTKTRLEWGFCNKEVQPPCNV